MTFGRRAVPARCVNCLCMITLPPTGRYSTPSSKTIQSVGELLPRQDRLPVHPRRYHRLDLLIGAVRPRPQQRPRVGLGLQQTRHDQRLEPPQRDRVSFDIWPFPEPVRNCACRKERLTQPHEGPRGTKHLVQPLGVLLRRTVRHVSSLPITDVENPIRSANCSCVSPAASRQALNSTANARIIPFIGASSSALAATDSLPVALDRASRP